MGLALAVLGLWMVVRGLGRRYGIALAAASLAWVAIALLVVIPHFNAGRGSEFVDRYGSLGPDGGGIAHTLLTRPWEAVQLASSYDRLSYLGALLIPLAFLSLAAPLLAAGALPELLINILADWFPQYSIEFQYVAVIVPFLVAAAILGPGAAAPGAAARDHGAPALPRPGGGGRVGGRRAPGGSGPGPAAVVERRARGRAPASAWSSTGSTITPGCWSARWP